MLRRTRHVFSDSGYPLFRNFTLVFDFFAKSDKDWVDEELFAKVKPVTYLEYSYYSTKLFVFVFKISSCMDDYYLAYEYYGSAYGSSSSIVNIFFVSNDSNDLVVRVSKYGCCRFGGGEFKIFPTIDKLMKYYEKYSDVDEDEDEEDCKCSCYYDEEEPEETED